MNALDYLALAAFLSPVFAVLAMNLCAATLGEEGTLLLPSLRAFPRIPSDGFGQQATLCPQERVQQVIHEDHFRQAA